MNLFDFSATTLAGTEQSLGDYRGRAVLVVNTASKCGLTPQFEALQGLYTEFHDQGLDILGFPCGQFANQEPGSSEDAAEFCQLNYGVTFPMFAKVDVNGANAHPLWVWLRSQKGGLMGSAIKWNFTKFLIGRDGEVIRRFGPNTNPAALADDVRAALAS